MSIESVGQASVAKVDEGMVPFGPGQTGGAYVALLGVIPRGEDGPPPHRHPHTDEGFYVAEGEATVQIEDREVVAGPGTFVFVPKGVVHTAWNSGQSDLRGLIVISPGGAEHLFEPAG